MINFIEYFASREEVRFFVPASIPLNDCRDLISFIDKTLKSLPPIPDKFPKPTLVIDLSFSTHPQKESLQALDIFVQKIRETGQDARIDLKKKNGASLDNDLDYMRGKILF